MMGIIVKARQARLDYQQRIGRDVSVQEVATEAGISRAALSQIEHGKTWPSRKVFEALCRIYRLEPGELLELTED